MSNNAFFEGTRRKLPSEIVFKLMMSNGSRPNLCVVEGMEDAIFYSHALNKADNFEFFPMSLCDSGDEDWKTISGKESVINACEYQLKVYPKKSNSVSYIVDHDFFGLYGIPDEVSKRVTVLPVYSYENYYFEDGNMEDFYNYHNIFGPQIGRIEEMLEEFYNELSPFYALLKICTATYMIESYKKYKGVLKPYRIVKIKDELFKYILRDVHNLDFTNVHISINDMIESISAYQELLDYFGECKIEFSMYRELFPGKELLRFLLKCINQLYGITVNLKDEEQIAGFYDCLHIDLNVK